MGISQHRKEAFKNAKIGIITLSSTRSLEEDKSGLWIKQYALDNGHIVLFHKVLDDNMEIIREEVLSAVHSQKPHAILLSGGTGISPKDVTIEAVKPLFQKELSAFSSLFTQLSFEEIGTGAILSRATAGIIRKSAIFCMPGSIKACRLACKSLIFPELGHLIKHMLKG